MIVSGDTAVRLRDITPRYWKYQVVDCIGELYLACLKQRKPVSELDREIRTTTSPRNNWWWV